MNLQWWKDGFELSCKCRPEHTKIELWHYQHSEGFLNFTSVVATLCYPSRISLETGIPPRDSNKLSTKQPLASADQTATLQRARRKAQLVTVSNYATALCRAATAHCYDWNLFGCQPHRATTLLSIQTVAISQWLNNYMQTNSAPVQNRSLTRACRLHHTFQL